MFEELQNLRTQLAECELRLAEAEAALRAAEAIAEGLNLRRTPEVDAAWVELEAAREAASSASTEAYRLKFSCAEQAILSRHTENTAHAAAWAVFSLIKEGYM